MAGLVSTIYDGTHIIPVDHLAAWVIQRAPYWAQSCAQEVIVHAVRPGQPLRLDEVATVTAPPVGQLKDKRGFQYCGGVYRVLGFAGRKERIRRRTRQVSAHDMAWSREASSYARAGVRLPRTELEHNPIWYVIHQQSGEIFPVRDVGNLEKILRKVRGIPRLCAACPQTFYVAVQNRGRFDERFCSSSCRDVAAVEA